MLTLTELGPYIEVRFTRAAFRLETLQAYDVTSDGSDFGRYLAGETEPTSERKAPWLAQLAAEHARGLHRHRVRVVTAPVTDYTRYECEWGYAPNTAAGEDIRVLDLTASDVDSPLVGYTGGDFWLITDHSGYDYPIVMHYSPGGQFLGADEAPETPHRYREIRDLAWQAAEPFEQWWAQNPQLHRDSWRVA